MDFKDYGDASTAPPPAGSDYEQKVIGWMSEAVSEGEAFLRSQPNFSTIDECIRNIMSFDDKAAMIPAALSRTRCNDFGKIALDLRSGLTDTKIFWEYTNNNHRYDQSAVMATKLAKAWWLNSQADMRFVDGIAHCLAAGSAAIRLIYDRASGEQRLQAWDIRDVLPVRINDYLDYDSGFAVIARKENTVNYLRALYPRKASQIVADRDGTSLRLGTGTLAGKIAQVASPLLRGILRDSQRSQSSLKVPSCDTFTIQVKDDSLNRTGQTVLMGPHDSQGRPEAPWSYAVEPGDPLYPRGRVIVCTKTCVLYDGPNIYWHGRFDFLKLTLDQWPFSFLGKSPLVDLLDIQGDLSRCVRNIANQLGKIERPDLIGDKNSVPRAQWEKLDTALPGLKAMQNPTMGKGIQIGDPSRNAQIIPVLIQLAEFYASKMRNLSGAEDVTNFAKVAQIPASETVERIMEAMSPAIRARSRTLEAFLRPLAQMVLANFMEFYTQAKTVRILGPNGAVLEQFDLDPGTLVPDYIHSEDFDAFGNLTPKARERGPRSRYDRALTFMGSFNFVIQPGSLLAASEVTRKLMYLQLARAGYLDAVTLLETLGVPNLGVPPDMPTDVIGRLKWQAANGIGMSANSAGRKATAQQMPQMRSDGKISESG